MRSPPRHRPHYSSFFYVFIYGLSCHIWTPVTVYFWAASHNAATLTTDHTTLLTTLGFFSFFFFLFFNLTFMPDLDPSYSVLLGSQPECGHLTTDHTTLLAVEVAVPIVVVAIVAGLFLALYVIPKFRLYRQTKKERDRGVRTEEDELDKLQFEKVQSMELRTVAGNYVVQL
jgi:hypothetical protein